MIVQLGFRIIWCCVQCRLGTYVTEARKFLNELKETCASVVEKVSDKISNMEAKLVKTVTDKVGSLVETNLNPRRSYADIAAMNKIETNRNALEPRETQNRKIKTYILKLKKSQSNEETRKEIESAVDPGKTTTIINFVKNINHGGIALKTEDNEKSDQFYEDLLQKTKEKYNVVDVQLQKPKIN